MNQQPDIFFRKKLEGYQMHMPAHAWEKIETRLAKKSNKKIWLRIAASVSILVAAAYLLWPKQNAPIAQSNVAQSHGLKDELPRKEAAIAKKLAAPANIGIPTNIKTKNDTVATGSKEKIQPDMVTTTRYVVDKKVTHMPATEGVTLSTPDQLTHTNDTLSTKVLSIAVQRENTDAGVTLIYSIDEVNEKYLNKDKVADATPEVKKPSTLKKLLHKVYEFKNDQDPLGELRQKKDEILALNFKNKPGNQ